MSTMITEVRASGEYKTYKKIVAEAQLRVDIPALTQEALSLHAGRLSRALHGEKRYSGRHLMEALLKDLAFRSRIAEIRVRVSLQMAVVEEATKAIRRYISTEYHDDLREFSTTADRKSFVDRILKSSLKYLQEGVTLIETLDLLLKDADQAGFGLRNATEILKLLSESKGRVV